MLASEETPKSSGNDSPAASPPRSIRSEELFLDQREILILHCQDIYRLRLTRSGKLILTK